MKRLLLFTAFFMAGISLATAQSYGIKAGLNFANLSGGDADGFDGRTGFHVGAIAEVKIFQNLALQPELLYSTQGAELEDAKYELGYLSLPVMAKFFLNDRLSIHFGPQFGVLVSESDEISVNDNNTFDFGLAGGLEYRLVGGLFAQARYNAGMSEISQDADIKNSVFQLSIGYLF